MTDRVAGQPPSRVGRPVGDARGPEYWRAIERRRCRLAERLARELAHPDPAAPPGAVSDFVAASAVKVRLASAVDAQIAMHDAPRIVAMAGSEMHGTVTGRGGVIMWVHALEGDDWSVVFPFQPFTGQVLVCLDDLGEHCMWISSGDGPEARSAVESFRTGIELALQTRTGLIAKGFLPAGGQQDA